MRTGRTKDLKRRNKEHQKAKDTEHLEFEVDSETDSYSQQRGREQVIYDEHPEAQFKNGGLNKQRAIRLNHPRLQHYLDEAAKLLEGIF